MSKGARPGRCRKPCAAGQVRSRGPRRRPACGSGRSGRPGRTMMRWSWASLSPAAAGQALVVSSAKPRRGHQGATSFAALRSSGAGERDPSSAAKASARARQFQAHGEGFTGLWSHRHRVAELFQAGREGRGRGADRAAVEAQTQTQRLNPRPPPALPAPRFFVRSGARRQGRRPRSRDSRELQVERLQDVGDVGDHGDDDTERDRAVSLVPDIVGQRAAMQAGRYWKILSLALLGLLILRRNRTINAEDRDRHPIARSSARHQPLALLFKPSSSNGLHKSDHSRPQRDFGFSCGTPCMSGPNRNSKRTS